MPDTGAAPVPVDAVLEQGEKLFNQVAVGDAAAKHLGGAAEQADEQHGLPDLVPHQADGLVQGGHDRDVKEQRGDEVGAPAKHPEKEVMYPVPDVLPLDQGGGHDEHRHGKDDDCPELLAGVRLAVLSLLFACGGAFAAGRSFLLAISSLLKTGAAWSAPFWSFFIKGSAGKKRCRKGRLSDCRRLSHKAPAFFYVSAQGKRAIF